MNMDTRWLFVDMNSYFASVEQQLQPRLRGRPTAVVPVEAETTCCIAASYEAKAFGVRTGTKVNEARHLCPEIVFVKSRTAHYVEYHKRIVAAVESVVPVDQVHSIDEMSCRLTGQQKEHQTALELGRNVKRAIAEQAGKWLKCSVGLAPNRLLAKVASDMQKPDGLTLLRLQDLPHALFELELDDLPGIGQKMLRRLHRAGIRSIQQLTETSPERMHMIWGSINGERWWHLLRGEDLREAATRTRQIGHSHVLAPADRNDSRAREILQKLTHKAALRLREAKFWASRLKVTMHYRGVAPWKASARLGDIQDTPTMLQIVGQLWQDRPLDCGAPYKVEVALTNLKSAQSCGLPLLPEQQRRQQVTKAMDAINGRLGQGAVFLGSMHNVRQAAPDRIAFRAIPELRPIHASAEKPETAE
ncbi:MAG: DNA polymerase thumb domain-containing protein [Rubinisphaera brasiliensis]|uniref:DNA polymerase Y family protein n=1 Tax=Rubinisphaera brasiliensis TaxID=119 RepID=UPI003919C78F